VTGGVDTYNAKYVVFSLHLLLHLLGAYLAPSNRYENGDIAHGGYSTGIRVHERFVFALPEGLSDEDAGP
jgi:NADPH:quinone reductase-like Zn-dependent oxidoreductase